MSAVAAPAARFYGTDNFVVISAILIFDIVSPTAFLVSIFISRFGVQRAVMIAAAGTCLGGWCVPLPPPARHPPTVPSTPHHAQPCPLQPPHRLCTSHLISPLPGTPSPCPAHPAPHPMRRIIPHPLSYVMPHHMPYAMGSLVKHSKRIFCKNCF